MQSLTGRVDAAVARVLVLPQRPDVRVNAYNDIRVRDEKLISFVSTNRGLALVVVYTLRKDMVCGCLFVADMKRQNGPRKMWFGEARRETSSEVVWSLNFVVTIKIISSVPSALNELGIEMISRTVQSEHWQCDFELLEVLSCRGCRMDKPRVHKRLVLGRFGVDVHLWMSHTERGA